MPAFSNKSYTDAFSILNDKLFQEAIYLSSGELYDAVYLKPSTSIDHIAIKQRLSILKYAHRTSTRCTPFGNFAGIGIGKIGTDSGINVYGPANFLSSTTLDIEFFILLANWIGQSPAASNKILYYPNTTLYNFDKNLRFIERNYNHKIDQLLLSSISNSKEIRKLLKLLDNGLSKPAMTDFLITKGFTENPDEADIFISSLIDNQVIVSELWPSITENNIEKFIAVFKKYQELVPGDVFRYFDKCTAALAAINSKLPGDKLQLIRKLEDLIKTQNAIGGTVRKSFTTTNLFINTINASVSFQIRDLVLEGLKVLNILRRNKRTDIDQFKIKFFERYEYEEIPLTEALDPDLGITFGNFTSENLRKNSLLKDFSFKEKQVGKTLIQDHEINTNSFFIRKYLKAIAQKADVIHLGDDDLQGYQENWSEFPKTISAGIEVINAGNQGDPLIFLKFAGGHSANSIIGRFALDFPEVSELSDDIQKFEMKNAPEDSIIAEIAYLPEDLSHSKILYRNSIYKYQIPIMSSPCSANKTQILLSDLWLSIDENNQFVLKSKKLNKKVIPRNSTADAFDGSTNPFYYFLSAMQGGGVIRGGLTYDLKDFNIISVYYPRIVYNKKIILSPKTWLIDLKKFNSGSSFDDFCFTIKKELNLPDKVLCVSGDNKLLIDFNLSYAYDLLKMEIKKGNLRLEEYFDYDSDPLIFANGKVYNNEVIFSLFRA